MSLFPPQPPPPNKLGTRVQTPALHEAGRTQSTGASGAVLRTGFAGKPEGPLAQRHTLLQAHGGGF